MEEGSLERLQGQLVGQGGLLLNVDALVPFAAAVAPLLVHLAGVLPKTQD